MEQGLNILFKTYWSSNGWRDGTISKEDFEIAKKEGYMFDYPNYETHDEVLKKLDILLAKINPKDVANAFLYSLSTRKLEYRSALGSYYYAKAIPKHELKEGLSNMADRYCCLCNWYAWEKKPNEYELKHGVNSFNFARYKFGGVGHTILNCALFDLEQFIKLPKVNPSNNDKEILKKILECVNKLEKKGKAGKLRDLISRKKIFKCNKDEISIILDILGICGILASKEFPSYEDKFVDAYYRSPVEHNNDFEYPINRWTASDNVNYEKFEKIFNYKIK